MSNPSDASLARQEIQWPLHGMKGLVPTSSLERNPAYPELTLSPLQADKYLRKMKNRSTNCFIRVRRLADEERTGSVRYRITWGDGYWVAARTEGLDMVRVQVEDGGNTDFKTLLGELAAKSVLPNVPSTPEPKSRQPHIRTAKSPQTPPAPLQPALAKPPAAPATTQRAADEVQRIFAALRELIGELPAAQLQDDCTELQEQELAEELDGAVEEKPLPPPPPAEIRPHWTPLVRAPLPAPYVYPKATLVFFGVLPFEPVFPRPPAPQAKSLPHERRLGFTILK